MRFFEKPGSGFWSMAMIGVGVFFCILIRLWSFRAGSPIPDEIFTHLTIQGNFREILQISIMDVHPPLYYFWVKLWCKVFGNSLLAIRMFSLLFSILNILLIAKILYRVLAPELGPARTGLYVMGGLILSNHPWIVSISSVARMYSMGNFLALSSSSVLIYYFKKPRGRSQYFGLILYGVLAGLLCLTHYVGAFVILAQALGIVCMLLFRRPVQIKTFVPYLLSLTSFIIVLAAWLPFAAQQVDDVHTNYWITEKGFHLYLVLLHQFFFSFPPFSILMAVVGCLGFIVLLAMASRNREVNVFYAGLFVIPPIVLIAFSVYWRPLISRGTVRYFSFSLIFFGIVWSLIISRWKNPIAAGLAIVSIGFAQIFATNDRLRAAAGQDPTVEYQLSEWVKQEVEPESQVLLYESPPFFMCFSYFWNAPDQIGFPDHLFILSNWHGYSGHIVHIACIPSDRILRFPIDSTEFAGAYLVSLIAESQAFIDQKILRLDRIKELQLNGRTYYLFKVGLHQPEGGE
jgi:4-amino-4-deoxy-L-arabinose transferase-like glycosyltransferase